MRRRLKRYRKQKGITTMATQTITAISVLPDTGSVNEMERIKNTVAARLILKEATNDFHNQRIKAENDFHESLASIIATKSLILDDVIKAYKDWKLTDDELKAKIEIAIKLKPIIEKLITELRASQQGALTALIGQLKDEAAVEDKKAESTRQDIAQL